jgi:hypothetical protein
VGCRVADFGLDGHGATTRQVPGQAGVPLKALKRLGPVGLAVNLSLLAFRLGGIS